MQGVLLTSFSSFVRLHRPFGLIGLCWAFSFWGGSCVVALHTCTHAHRSLRITIVHSTCQGRVVLFFVVHSRVVVATRPGIILCFVFSPCWRHATHQNTYLRLVHTVHTQCQEYSVFNLGWAVEYTFALPSEPGLTAIGEQSFGRSVKKKNYIRP